MAKKKKWIQSANLKAGAFSRKAKKAKKGVQTFARTVLASKGKYSTKTVKQAVLAQTFRKMARKKMR